MSRKEDLNRFGAMIDEALAELRTSPPRVVEQKSLRSLLDETEEILSALPERGRKAVELRLGLTGNGYTKTFTRIGQEIGCSRWTASRIYKKALVQLRPANRSTQI